MCLLKHCKLQVIIKQTFLVNYLKVFCFSQKLGVGGIQDEVYFYHRRRCVRARQGHLRRVARQASEAARTSRTEPEI